MSKESDKSAKEIVDVLIEDADCEQDIVGGKSYSLVPALSDIQGYFIRIVKKMPVNKAKQLEIYNELVKRLVEFTVKVITVNDLDLFDVDDD